MVCWSPVAVAHLLFSSFFKQEEPKQLTATKIASVSEIVVLYMVLIFNGFFIFLTCDENYVSIFKTSSFFCLIFQNGQSLNVVDNLHFVFYPKRQKNFVPAKQGMGHRPAPGRRRTKCLTKRHFFTYHYSVFIILLPKSGKNTSFICISVPSEVSNSGWSTK